MKETLKVLNQMVKAGVIKRYAIGGAVAAIYYLEPFDTSDLDVFVEVNVQGSGFQGERMEKLSLVLPMNYNLL